ncbi:MAG: LamG-like jellyroll fold domain-containing protein [Ferruginibacter sp.]
MNAQNLPIILFKGIKTKILGFTLVIFSFCTAAFAQSGQALQFNGIDNYISLPSIPLSGDYTKEVWISTNSLTSFPNILTGDPTTGTALFLNNGSLAAGHGPAFNQVVDPTPLVIGTWYHVAVTYNATSQAMNLYKDGILVASATAPAYTETQLEIGRFAGNYYFDGSIDEVRIWNVERTPAQIAAFKDCPLNGSEAGLIAYYNFNQGIAGGTNTGLTTLNDLHGDCPANGKLNNFALTGTTSNWIAPGGTTTTCTVQVPNISVSGNDNCIAIGDVTPSTTDNTDFGSTAIGTPVDQTFVIHNNGGASLTSIALVITGADAGSYSIITTPSATLLPNGDSTSFTIRFNPATTGTKNANITVVSDDLDEATYTYAITGMANAVVPVTLISFNASRYNDISQLSWETATELNNAGFSIQRSNDGGISWQSIGFVKALNFPTGSKYSFNDLAPLKGINAYRIKQVDIDGRFSNSNTALLNFSSLPALVKMYPNPVTDKLTIVFNDSKLLNTKVNIITASGSVISTTVLNNYNQALDISRIANGLYFVRFSNGTMLKFIKQ